MNQQQKGEMQHDPGEPDLRHPLYNQPHTTLKFRPAPSFQN